MRGIGIHRAISLPPLTLYSSLLNSVNLEHSGRFKDLRRCIITSDGQSSTIQQLALQPIN
nr:MAG TPA: hypothetical protein [Caudoviricetes sp.]